MNDVAATTQSEGQRKGRRALTRYQLVGLTKDLFIFHPLIILLVWGIIAVFPQVY